MIFLDSNVVVAFFAESHPYHARCHAFVIGELKKGTLFAISPQVVSEAFRALTSRHAVEHPIPPAEFMRLVDIMLGAPNLHLVCPGRVALVAAVQTATRLDLTSHRIYDLLIYGTMRECGISRLATLNVKHFSALDDIELVQIP